MNSNNLEKQKDKVLNSFFKLDNKLKNNLSEPIFKILKGNKFLNNYATFFSN